jgi:excinuclease ABC subunit A
MRSDVIEIRGAREHNLKNLTVRIPKDALVVVTGVSGSGKSSLAFDTLYAEGQRRYVESLSSYARQFLGQMEKPKYDSIRGLSPTIAIEQKAASNNPRSTVGTVTEIHDHLRVMYARVGVQHCHLCGKKVGAQTAQEIAHALSDLPAGTRAQVMIPIARARKGEFAKELEQARDKGFVRARVDGTAVDLSERIPKLDKKSKHDVFLVVDRIVAGKAERARVTDSVETALREGKGVLVADIGGELRVFSEQRACHDCGVSFEEPSPQTFSFNSPVGACEACKGLGTRQEMDPELLVPRPELSIRDGAVAPWASSMARGEGWKEEWLVRLCRALGARLDTPWKKLAPTTRKAILHGDGEWEGLGPQLMRRYLSASSDEMKAWYGRYLSDRPCDACEGTRLRPESRAVRVGGVSIDDLTGRTVAQAHAWLRALELGTTEQTIAEELEKEILGRLGFLLDVGLDYLTLDRPSGTLSGGESQRIRLASQIGSELTGVVYVLDEPSIGLHQRDNERLLATLRRLRDLGNTVVVVEHDEETIREADHVIDVGPGAGVLGGELVAQGTPAEVASTPKSVTGAFLSGRRSIAVPAKRREGSGKALEVQGARANNLKDVDARFPLGVLVAVTGVSGAGKSTLVGDVLEPALARKLHDAHVAVGAHRALRGTEHIDKVVPIDQQPIGRTPRSNPATYTKLFDHVRDVFAQTKEARSYGYDRGRFSFNVKGGRCEACGGGGVRQVEMHFLPDVLVMCEACKGKRFNEATLRVRFKDKTIADVLDMSVTEALAHFAAHKEIARALRTLEDVGMGYVKLGQPSPTLSGGEAQRIKLARELSRVATGRTVYVLDEPTTGLHFLDVERLLVVLHRFVDAGNTVIVIEHNLDVIKNADWVIDMGPEGGERGGRIIAQGTPELVAATPGSATGAHLARLLGVALPRSQGARAATRGADRVREGERAVVERAPHDGRRDARARGERTQVVR